MFINTQDFTHILSQVIAHSNAFCCSQRVSPFGKCSCPLGVIHCNIFILSKILMGEALSDAISHPQGKTRCVWCIICLMGLQSRTRTAFSNICDKLICHLLLCLGSFYVGSRLEEQAFLNTNLRQHLLSEL